MMYNGERQSGLSPQCQTNKNKNMSKKYGFQFFQDIIIIHGLTLLAENIDLELIESKFEEDIEAKRLTLTRYVDDRPQVIKKVNGGRAMTINVNPHQGLEKVRIEGYCDARKWQKYYPKAKLLGKLEKGIDAKAEREKAKLEKQLGLMVAGLDNNEQLPF
jgi:hypothetical protein